ncbi:MAG: hypothetical protein NDI63_00960 [Pseudobdellovibrio sp.]|nr:hypothetical protein [Pseudobdellovibrio sp.]
MKFSSEWFNKKLFFGFIILVALLALIDWFLFGRTPMHEIKTVTEAAKVVGAKITGKPGGFAGAAQAHAAQAHAASATAALQATPVIDAATATPEQFKAWFDSEVHLMNQYNVNEEQMQQRYLELTAKMTPAQFKQLSVVARTKSPNVNERILAAYLLGYSGYANINDLSALVTAPIQLDGKPEPHSVAETQQVQERALRVLAINRLANLAQGNDPEQAKKAVAELKRLATTLKDPSLKNYAENKLKEISK